MNVNEENVSVSDQLLNDAAQSGIVEPIQKTGNDGGNNDQSHSDGQNSDQNQNQNQNQNQPGGGTDGNEEEDVDDAKLLALLKKRGISAEKLDDLKPADNKQEPTEEEKRAAEEQKRSKAVKFGLENKLFTQTEYDASVAFNARPMLEVVKEDFTTQMKKAHPELDDTDIEDLFEEKFFLSENEGGAKHKLGQQELAEYYNRIKQQRFGKILDVTKVYDGYETNLSRATSYKQQIDHLFTEIPQQKIVKIEGKDVPAFTFPVGNDNITIPIDLTALDAIKKDYLTESHMTALMDQTGNIADRKAVSEEVLKDLFWKSKDKIIAEVATAYSDKRLSEERKGRKNAILPEHTSDDKGQGAGSSLSDRILQGTA